MADNADASTVATLQPLEPHPVPDQHRVPEDEELVDDNNDDNQTAHTLKEFECAICYEVMGEPVGCGSCQARFCRPCLERVADLTTGDDTPKCCYCTKSFTRETIQVDEKLLEKINECTISVTCPFRGCGKKTNIGAAKLHEEQCGHIRMRCKFADWGCTWVGKKMHLEHHDQNECEFRKVLGRLVEGIREKNHEQSNELASHRDNMVRLAPALNANTKRMLMIRGRNGGNVFDVLAMSYEMICFPGRFTAAKEMWGNMITQPHPRSMTLNTLLTFPSLIMISKCTFWACCEWLNMEQRETTRLGYSGVFTYFSWPIITTISAFLAVACILADSTNAFEWMQFDMGYIGGKVPLLQYGAALLFLTSMRHFALYYADGGSPYLLVLTLSMTVYFASLVAQLIEKITESEVDILKKARMWSVMVFALKYTCLFNIFGYDTIYASILFGIIRTYVKLPSILTMDETECCMTTMHPLLLLAHASALMLGKYNEMKSLLGSEVSLWNLLPESDYRSLAIDRCVVPVLWLVLLNVYCQSILYWGKIFGDMIYVDSENYRAHAIQRIQSYNLLPTERPSLWGTMGFSAFAFYIIFLIIV